MLALFRSIVYAALFVSFVLVFIPDQILRAAGITGPTQIGTWHWMGLALVVLGGALAVWCILTFALVGQGTPAPFDPPRKLVAAGPYRWSRNPMYVGAGTALFGAALFYQSAALLAFAADDYESASKAALAGGTTTLIEMICPGPQDEPMAAFELWKSKAEPLAAVDYTFHMSVVRFEETVQSQFREIVGAGVASFKVFLAYKGALNLSDAELF